MKTSLRPSPAMIVALVALFVALGGSALGYGLGREGGGSGTAAETYARAAHHHAHYRLRSGKIIDSDTTPGDGSFNDAVGHAFCKHGERLISGGVRLRGGLGGVFPGLHVALVDSGPAPKRGEWAVTLSSDLGGEARKRFVVFAYCKS